ncbi:MAG: DUF3500 domain-containing protein [Pirellulaceae bacterium]
MSRSESSRSDIDRRHFLRATAVGAAAAAAVPSLGLANDPANEAPETLVKVLFDSLSDQQKGEVCFAWDHTDDRGLLRTRVSNNWHITKPTINSEFFNDDQRHLIRHIYEGIIQPEWHAKIDAQLQDDAGSFGNDQNIAIFGTPGTNEFEFVMTGRHMTMRCDGDSAEHVAFGGPIFYGHAAQGFNEEPDHPGNVFWEQALMANEVYKMLDGRQRALAEVGTTPAEAAVAFRGSAEKPGIPVSEMSGDQKEHMGKVLAKLLEPYRMADRNEVQHCLEAQGGLDACSLAFYTDRDLGNDQVWDNWRLEGPSFVWYFRGNPHVHVWVNIASNATSN